MKVIITIAMLMIGMIATAQNKSMSKAKKGDFLIVKSKKNFAEDTAGLAWTFDKGSYRITDVAYSDDGSLYTITILDDVDAEYVLLYEVLLYDEQKGWMSVSGKYKIK